MTWIKKFSPEFWRVVVPSFVIGLCAGVLGAVLAWSTMLAYESSLVVRGPLSVVRSRTAPDVETELVHTLVEQVGPSVVDVFVAKAEAAAHYQPQEAVGHGVVFTTDGWVISHRTAIDPHHKNRFRLGIGSAVYPITTIREDEETGMLFIKVAAENLHPVAVSSASVDVGDRVAALSGARQAQLVRVRAARERAQLTASSDVLETRMALVEALPQQSAGAPLITMRGELVGVLVSDDHGATSAVPVQQVISLFPAVLNHQRFIRPMLGVRGAILAGSRTASAARDRGFLVEAVIRGLPADVASINVGDMIVKVNDTVLTDENDLAELLLALHPADTVELTIVRAEREQQISVVLGERESGKDY